MTNTSLWETLFDMNTPNGVALSSTVYAPLFFRQYRFLRRSQWWTTEQHQAYQLKRLTTMIRQAYDNVPYYRRLLDSLHLTPDDFKTLEDLAKLPLLTKEEVRSNSTDLKARNYPAAVFEPISTSGSTGSPLTRYVERGKAPVIHFAFFKTILDRAGMNYLSRALLIHGNDTPFSPQLFGRGLLITPFTLTEENMTMILSAIRKVNPEYIIAFPSAVSLLAHHIQSRGDNPFRQLKVVYCAGETLFSWQRRFLEEILGCPVLVYYDQTEQVALAATCMQNPTVYHFYPEWGITELIDENGDPVTTEGGRGEIVGTGFTNALFPLFRYRTGDVGVFTTKECACGRHYPLITHIEGRTQEFIVSKTGDTVPMTGMYATVPEYSTHVKEYQFSQRHPGDLVLHIVREPGYTLEEEKRIIEALRRRIGDGFDISVEYIEVAERSARGKILFLVKK